jgi:hypothetical protein
MYVFLAKRLRQQYLPFSFSVVSNLIDWYFPYYYKYLWLSISMGYFEINEHLLLQIKLFMYLYFMLYIFFIYLMLCLFVCLDFTARQHINGHIVPNAIIGLKYYVKICK